MYIARRVLLEIRHTARSVHNVLLGTGHYHHLCCKEGASFQFSFLIIKTILFHQMVVPPLPNHKE